MAEKYDALVAKVRDWSNRPEEATVPTAVIQDCLNYSADEIYRTLRIPPLENTALYTITSFDNPIGDTYTAQAYTVIPVPTDLIQFVYIRTKEETNIASKVFHEKTDERTFFDIYAFKYNRNNWMRKGNEIFIHPQLKEGTVLEIHYYRRLPGLDTLYSVIPANYEMGIADNAQTYLSSSTSLLGTPLYVTATAAYASLADKPSSDTGTPVTKYFIGKEVGNWLRDNNERLLVWGALGNLGSYLSDEKMEQRYTSRFISDIASLNKEEKFRRASGGNVQMNFNSNDLI
jgi:hypothetical protein